MSKMKNADSALALEYETQYFEFHPRSFVDAVYNIFHSTVTNGLTSFTEYLEKEFSELMPAYEIQSQSDLVYKEAIENLDKAIDKLEVYLVANIMMIPDHVLLPEDKVHAKIHSTQEDHEKLDQEIEELKEKIIHEKKKRSILKRYMHDQKTAQTEMIESHQKLMHLHNIAAEEGLTEETIKSAVANILELSNIIAQVKENLGA